MALDLQAYKAKKLRTLTADLGDGDELEFKYDSAAYTEDFIKELKKLSGVEGDDTVVVSLDVANYVVRTLVKESDLVSGGKPVDLSDQTVVSSLPLQMTAAITNAIFEDQNPGNE